MLDNPPVTMKRLGRRHSYITTAAHLTSNNDPANGLTFRVCHSFLSKPSAVRAVFLNHLPTAVTFDQHYAATASAPSASLGPATSSEWTAGGAVLCPPAIDAVNFNPSITYGPWIPVYAQESATDPGTYPVMIQAILKPTYASYWTPYEDQLWRASEPKKGGMYWEARQQSGADTTANPGLFSDTTVRNRSAIAGMEALCADGSAIAMKVGDSITAGAGQTNYGMCEMFQAVRALNLAGSKISFIGQGFGGQNSIGYWARCMYALPILKPDVLIFSAGTPNDGVPSLPGQRANRFQIQQVLDLARSLGCTVILRGWAPHSVAADNWPQGTLTATPTGTVPGDVYRLDQNAQCAAMDGIGGVLWMPGPATLGDGAVPERYKAGYTDDTNHPNAPAYVSMVPGAMTVIAKAVANLH